MKKGKQRWMEGARNEVGRVNAFEEKDKGKLLRRAGKWQGARGSASAQPDLYLYSNVQKGMKELAKPPPVPEQRRNQAILSHFCQLICIYCL